MKKNLIYQHSGQYAQEHDELKKYFASHNAHMACKEAIGQAIADHHRNNILSRDAAKEVIAEFGIDRTLYVLAATIRAKDSDGRIDQDNKAWARAFPLVEDMDTHGRDRTMELEIYRSHPGLIDIFAHMVRDEASLSLPIYRGTYDLAKETGELAEYRMSRRVNLLCQEEIDDAVSAGWDGMHVAPDAVKAVLERFGPERVAYVLANTVQQKEWEDRFSGANVSWAKTVPLFVPPEKRAYCTARSHPAKLDEFITVARKEMLQMEQECGQPAKRRSVRKKLQKQPDAPAAPSVPGKSKSKGQER